MHAMRSTARTSLTCTKCSSQCASTAKFCARCGTQLRLKASTKLPSLDASRPSTMAGPPMYTSSTSVLPVTRTRATAALSPPRRKRPLVKKPARIARLEVEQPAPREDHDHKLKVWMASTRRLLESLLELKRRLDHPERDDAVDPSRFQSIECILHALQLDLTTLAPCFAHDRNLQAKCVAMLVKLNDLYRATQLQLASITSGDASVPQSDQRAKSPVKLLSQDFPDAEVVIRGADGKRIFFRARQKSPTRRAFDETDGDALGHQHQQPSLTQHHAPAVLPLHHPEFVSTTIEGETDADTLVCVMQPRMKQFLRERWPELLVFRVARVDGRVVLLRLQESDELHQLVIELYRPLSSTAISVIVPLEWLAFILPPSITWYRVSEVRRYKAVEAHWSRCFNHIERCLKWTSTGTAISVRFPIQFRQARIFTFRSFAVLYGLLSVHIQPPDYALKIVFVNARTNQRATLTLAETAIVRCLGARDPYRERLVGTTTRKTLCAQVCDRLYVEYTSRGFELLFPGVKPKGTIRRHPQELSVMQHRTEQLDHERASLKAAMDRAIEQAVVLARRRMESYLERMRRARKEKQTAAARTIQTRARGLVAKKRIRRQREEMRRASRLQELAAVLIQREFRRHHDAARQQRARQQLEQDTRGLRFRLSCRVNGTLVLAIVSLDELDAAANAFDCTVWVVHPSTSQTAQLRVAYRDVLRLTKHTSLVGCARSAIVGTLVRDHLDVFRSAKHDVLVLALRS